MITPKGLALEQLEKFQKKILKQLLSVPPNTPDPAIYILSGILPIEAQIHIKVLNFYNNVCNQAETSIEKQLARRQLSIKAMDSNSWFIDVENILYKYDLANAYFYMEQPSKKEKWNKLIKERISKEWIKKITLTIPLYHGLRYLNFRTFGQGKSTLY